MPDRIGVRQDRLLGASNLNQKSLLEAQDGHVTSSLSSRFCRFPKGIPRCLREPFEKANRHKQLRKSLARFRNRAHDKPDRQLPLSKKFSS